MALNTPFFNSGKKTEARDERPTPNAAAVAAHNPLPTQTIAPAAEAPSGDAKLTVGPNIKLKGVVISDCDTLVVEGSVEASMNSRMIQISERGSFVGAVEVEDAEIRGAFEGDLTARKRLVIHSTGRVSGVIRYGKLVVEEGGEICGDSQVWVGSAAQAARSTGPKNELGAALPSIPREGKEKLAA